MIRKLQPGDTEEVLAIWLEASVIAHHFIPAGYWQNSLPEMRTTYLPASDTHVYISPEGTIAGFISMVDNYIAAIFVKPAFQGRGVGSQLLSYVQELYPTGLILNVYKENQRSVQFYKRHGFTVEEERIDPATGHPELVMKRINTN